MARRAANNPRQLRSKSCGCTPCRDKHPTPERKPRRDCIGPWQARYRDADGKQRGRCFDTLKEAQAFLDEVRSSVRQGTYLDPRRAEITIEKWWESWWAGHKKGRTTTINRKLSSWNAHIRPRWGKRKLGSLTYMELQDWITNEVRGHATQIKVITLLNMMLRDAVRDRRIPYNPASDLQVTAEPPAKHRDDLKPPTEAEYAAIREHLPAYYQPLADFAQETGMRWGEVTGLRWAHVDLEAGTADVREVLVDDHGYVLRQGMPKTVAGIRTVGLTEKAMHAVKAVAGVWLDTEAKRKAAHAHSVPADGMREEELVFRGPQGAPLRGNNFRRRVWIPALKASGVGRLVKDPETGRDVWWPRFHDYRHAVASRLHEAGVSERDVQDFLGQERGGRVTWLYTHGSDEARETVRDALETGRRLRVVS